MRIRFLAIGLIAGLLAACTSGDADPKPTPSPSAPPSTASSRTPSRSPSPSRTGPLTTGPNVRPGEKPPEVGPLGRKRTDAGATTAGAYYFRALDWVIATNDGWLVQDMSMPGCAACERVRVGLAALKSRHEVEKGGRIQVRSAVVDRTRYHKTYDYAVRVVYDEGAVRLVMRDGSARTTQPAASGNSAVVFLSWVDGRWRVVDVAQAA